MDGKTKSIILQVAYKGVVESGSEVTEDAVVADYNLLIGLHDKLGIDSSDAPRGGSGGRKPAGKPSGGGFQTPESVTTFTFQGELVEDFREAKANNEVKGGFPDFKYVTLKDEKGQRKSEWLYDQEGNPNTEVAELVAAADGKVF